MSISGLLKIKTLTHKHRFFPIIKLIFILLSMCFCGCAVLSPATDRLSHSNKDYISRNEHTVDIDCNFKENSSVKADFLGKQDRNFIYSALGPNGQKVYFQLPECEYCDYVIVSRDAPIPKEITSLVTDKIEENKKIAMFHFYSKEKDLWKWLVQGGPKRELLEKINLDRQSGYPVNVYVGSDKYYYSYFDRITGHNSKLETELSGFDNLLLGVRSLGYLITVPIDAALTVAFAAFSPFIPLCGMWGCP